MISLSLLLPRRKGVCQRFWGEAVKQGEIFKNFRYSIHSDMKDKRTKKKVLI